MLRVSAIIAAVLCPIQHNTNSSIVVDRDLPWWFTWFEQLLIYCTKLIPTNGEQKLGTMNIRLCQDIESWPGLFYDILRLGSLQCNNFLLSVFTTQKTFPFQPLKQLFHTWKNAVRPLSAWTRTTPNVPFQNHFWCFETWQTCCLIKSCQLWKFS